MNIKISSGNIDENVQPQVVGKSRCYFLWDFCVFPQTCCANIHFTILIEFIVSLLIEHYSLFCRTFTIRHRFVIINMFSLALPEYPIVINCWRKRYFFLGILNTVDPDNFGHAARQSFTYTLLNQTVPFVINGDKLATTVSLDYEMKPSYDLLIKSVDNGFPSLSFQTMIKISVVGKYFLFVF